MSYPNYKNKHLEIPLFQAKDFLNYQKKIGNLPNIKLPKKAILCYSNSILKYILDNYKTKSVPGFTYSLYIINIKDNPICICGGFGTGAPSSITVLEELIALGIKEFISVGTAGTIQKNINIGDIILCDKAIRDEGTSYHYCKPEKYSYSSEKLNKKIIKELKLLKEKFIIGTSWTTDAPYRETISEVKKYQKENVLTVEMEASALFTVAKIRKVNLSSLLTISDSLAGLKWNPNFSHSLTSDQKIKLVKIAINVLIK